MTASYFPIFVDLKGQPVLVVGGGEVAARKIRLLLRSAAQVQVVARELNEDLAAMAADGTIRHAATAFAAANRARVAERFELSTCLRAHLDLYERVVSGG